MGSHFRIIVIRVHLPDLPDFPGKAKHRKYLWPSNIEGDVCQDGSDLLLGHPMGLGILKMILQGRSGNTGRYDGNNGDNASGLQIDLRIIPVLAKKHIIVEMGEFRGEISHGFSACCLYDLFCHFPSSVSTTFQTWFYTL